MKIKLPALHKAQREILEDPARFKVCLAGRRWGKSYMASVSCLRETFEHRGLSVWASPSYSVSSVGFKALKSLCKNIPHTEILESTMTIRFPFLGGSAAISCRSLERPENLRGLSIQHVVVDECAYVKSGGIFDSVLRPALADNAPSSSALLISTPRGRGEFFEYYHRGLSDQPEFKDWKSFHYPSSTNPWLKQEEIDAAKASMPEATFRVEFLAEFGDDSSTVFTGIDDILCPKACTCNRPAHCVGIDLGRKEDSTSVCVLCSMCGKVVEMHSFSGQSWETIENSVIRKLSRFPKARILVDATGVGDGILANLKRKGLNCKGFIFTNKSKHEIISDLVFGIENKLISINPRERQLIDQLSRFEYKMTANRNITYSAPSNMHDDDVCSLALAYSLFNPRKSGSRVLLTR